MESLLHSGAGGIDDDEDRPSTLTTITPYILVTEFCERLAYYGFAGSLVLFFQTKLGYSNATADVHFALWSGVCYLSPLIGGWLADRYLGRFKAIFIFCVIYLLGLGLMVIGSSPDTISPGLVFPAIYVIAIGTGGIKPNVSTFGADQFLDTPRDQKEKESFFNWFYWSINFGAMISYLFVAYICQYGIQGLGGEDWGFFVGYSIPLISMALGLFIFVSGKSKYRMKPPSGSIVEDTVAIIYFAGVTNRHVETDHWLDRALREHGGRYDVDTINAVKSLTRLFPFLLAFIPYWSIYSQMATSFQNQGCQMDLSIGSFEIPISALNMANTFSILLLIPVFEKVVFPYFQERGRPLTLLQKIGWGYVLAAISVLSAAILEIIRKKYVSKEGPYPIGKDDISYCKDIFDYNPQSFQAWFSDHSNDKPLYCHKVSGCDTLDVNGNLDLNCISCDDIPQIASISVFWQIPQFVFIGMSEILASVTGLEFFYSQAPTSMRSVSQAMNLLTVALGSFVIIPLIYLVNIDDNQEWVSSNLNEGYLERFFFLLCAIMVFCTFIFVKLALGYEYVFTEEQEKNFRDSIASSDSITGSLRDVLSRLSITSRQSSN